MRLEISGAQLDGEVAIDGLVLRQVAENLISNAMKYAPGSAVELSIRNGIAGLPPAVGRGPRSGHRTGAAARTVQAVHAPERRRPAMACPAAWAVAGQADRRRRRWPAVVRGSRRRRRALRARTAGGALGSRRTRLLIARLSRRSCVGVRCLVGVGARGGDGARRCVGFAPGLDAAAAAFDRFVARAVPACARAVARHTTAVPRRRPPRPAGPGCGARSASPRACRSSARPARRRSPPI